MAFVAVGDIDVIVAFVAIGAIEAIVANKTPLLSMVPVDQLVPLDRK